MNTLDLWDDKYIIIQDSALSIVWLSFSDQELMLHVYIDIVECYL